VPLASVLVLLLAAAMISRTETVEAGGAS